MSEMMTNLARNQQLIWLDQQLEPDRPVYNEAFIFEIRGRLDVERFRAAFQHVLNTTDSLRTVFEQVDGVPRQRIVTGMSYEVPLFDATEAADPAAAWSSFCEARCHRVLSLETCSFDAVLGKLSETHWFWLLNQHHLITDGLSVLLVHQRVSERYQKHTTPADSEAWPSYLRYVELDGAYRVSVEGQRDAAFWTARAQSPPERLTLYGRLGPGGRSGERLRQSVELGEERFSQLLALVENPHLAARSKNATMTTIYLAAVAAYLYRISGQRSFGIGVPFHDRKRTGLWQTTGLLAKVVPLRIAIPEGATFRSLIVAIREELYEALRHGSYGPQNTDQRPAYEAMVNFITAAFEDFAQMPTKVRWRHPEFGVGSFALHIHQFTTDEPPELEIDISRRLFDDVDHGDAKQHFMAVLDALLNDSEQLVDAVDLLDTQERRKIMSFGRGSEKPLPAERSVTRLFEQQARTSPNAAAVRCGQAQLSYAQLDVRANAVAGQLRTLGVTRGSLVGIYVDRGLSMVVALLGVLKAGAGYVPLDPRYPAERIAFMLSDCEAQALLTSSELKPHLPPYQGQVVCLDKDWPAHATQHELNPDDAASPEDVAYVIYTSGSTGRPKGVQVPHRALLNFLASMADSPGLDNTDVLLSVTTLSFDIAALEIFLPLTCGATVVIARSEQAADGAALAALLSEAGVTVMQATPATWRLLIESGWQGDGRLKALCGGEAWSWGLARELLDRCDSVWNMYGPTETTIWSAARRLHSTDERVFIGEPVANTQLYVLDEDRRIVPVGVPGELYIGGLGLALGYLNRPELTQKRFVCQALGRDTDERLYRTGDRVRYRGDGTLEFTGRLDHQVKLRGYRIELGEIEAALERHEAVSEAAVLLRQDRPGDRKLVGYVTLIGALAVTASQLRAWLRTVLPEYMVPASVVTLTEMPRTPNRKLDRAQLPRPEAERQVTSAYEEPSSELERALAEIWQQLLAVERIGRSDQFFELGGHSLLATQLMSRIRAALAIEVPLHQIFATPELASLADWIERERTRAEHAAVDSIEPAPREDEPPLSFAQTRIWFLDQMGAGAAYNMPSALRLRGELDLVALERSVNAIVARHEALRTTFALRDGKPRQLIARETKLKLEVVDYTHIDSTEHDAAVKQLTIAEASRPFSLSQGPLLRATVVRLAERHFVLLLTSHHIISDGWSIGLFNRELCAHYEAYRHGREPDLPPLAIQYADFAIWQRGRLQEERLDRLLAYWRGQLGAELPALQLPTDRSRGSTQAFLGAAHRFRLDGALVAALSERAQAEDVTLAMLLMAAFKALLCRYSGQDDIVVGSPIANRTRAELEELLGFFVNSLVLRTDLSNDPTFSELVQRVRRTCMAAYEHQDLPFERLVDELSPERNLSHNPLFQVVFAMQNAPRAELLLSGLSVHPMPPTVTHTRTDLELHLFEQPDGLDGLWVYNTALFDAETIERMAGHFEALLGGVLAAPQQRISQLPLLSEAERSFLLHELNNTRADDIRVCCIHELIEEQAARTPEAVAVSCGHEQLTYRQLNARANQLAYTLRTLGVEPNKVVALCVERGPRMIVGMLGILKAGGAYLPIDADYPQQRQAFMLQDSAAAVLITEEPLLSQLPQHGARAICLDRDWPDIATGSTANPSVITGPQDLAYVIYTSGSTGTPKGVLLSHGGLSSLSEVQHRVFGADKNSRVLQFSSFSFDAATFEIVMALPKGGTLLMASRGELLPGPDLLRFLQEQRVSIVTLTPTALAALPAAELPHLKTITVAGEACAPELVERWAVGRRFFNLYGPTEATIWASMAELRPGDGPVHIGRPIDNVRIHILDDHLRPVPIGVAGEIHIGGIGVARGYHRREKLTKERFVPDPFSDVPGARLYKTGDRARYRPDGNIAFLGRFDQQVKLRGYRMELGEIEAALVSHPSVRESLTMIREDTPGDRRLTAYVVADHELVEVPETTATTDDHIAHWQTVHEDTYVEAQQVEDPTFNISGWNDSYTGDAIPHEQMRVWVDAAISDVLAESPERVLELGCGNGLLLFGIAPHTQQYVGVDFSPSAVNYVRRQLPHIDGLSSKVELKVAPAHDFSGLPDNHFDMVVINSVVQYFPSADYLLRVLKGAVRVLREGGRIYIGDVRSLPLLAAFHTSIQLHLAPDELSSTQLQRRAHQQANQDRELVIAPGLFQTLPAILPKISRIDIQPKSGRYDNELSRFRYDVMLHLDGDAPIAVDHWIFWRREGLNLEALRAQLLQKAPERLGLRAVPNRRTHSAVWAVQRLNDEDCPQSAAGLRRELAARAHSDESVAPEELQELAAELGYEVTLSMAAGRVDGSFDAWLYKPGSLLVHPQFVADIELAPGAKYTNQPLRGQRLRQLAPVLRRHALQRLPEYMVPAAIIVLDAFPTTPNGKLDVRALPAPDALRPELLSDYVPPRSEVEQVLASIWARVLDVEQVGVHDNFFELGGDSILSIQIVASARRANLHFRAQDMFERQTVAELAAVVTAAPAFTAEQGMVTGEVPLTPIQHWFFEQALAEPHHFNQALMFELRRPTKEPHLSEALRLLSAHHDALRLRFVSQQGGWQQAITEELAQVPLSVVELGGLGTQARLAAVEQAAERAQSSLELSSGPLLRAVLFREDDAADKLLLVCHHLAIDGVSWRILLEDLQAALDAIERGQSPRLAAKTTSFKSWAERLHVYAQKPVIAEQLSYWRTLFDQYAAVASDVALPCDEQRGANTVGSMQHVSLQLSKSDTQTLLQELPAVHDSRIDDALLSALLRALLAWTGRTHWLLDLESHGRQEVMESVDLSRTVGWFTSIYPIFLHIADSENVEATLQSVKDQLRAIPDHGIGFGLARYLAVDEEQQAWLRHLPKAEVSFNYLGQLDSAWGRRSRFQNSDLSVGTSRSPHNARAHQLEINAVVLDGCMHMRCAYSESHLRPESMTRFIEHLRAELAALAACARTPRATDLSAADLSAFGWEQDDLDDILVEIDVPE